MKTTDTHPNPVVDPIEAHRRGALLAHPFLSRYQPLPRILAVDRFEEGMHGWQGYFPDYDGWEDYEGRYDPVDPLKTILAQSATDPAMRIDRRLPIGRRPLPMISSVTSWDNGSHGGWNSTFVLKVPTLAQAGSKGFAQKRLGSPYWDGKFRLETWFTFKAEASDYRLGETDVASFMLTFDVQDPHHIREEGRETRRWWPALRYHNAEDGRLVRHWQANLTGAKGVKDGPWTYLKDGQQDLGYNRSATKYQWHYLRFTFDLARHEFVDFHCYGKDFDVAGLTHDPQPPLQGFRASTEKCPGLIGTGLGIEAASDKRCFLFVDSVVVSASEV